MAYSEYTTLVAGRAYAIYTLYIPYLVQNIDIAFFVATNCWIPVQIFAVLNGP